METMTRQNKILLGIGTFLPYILGIIIFIAYFASMISFANYAETEGDIPAGFFGMFGFAFVLIMILAVISLATFVYYIYHIVTNKKFQQPEHKNMLILWLLLILFASSIGKIAYFFVEVWPLPEPGSKNQGESNSSRPQPALL